MRISAGVQTCALPIFGPGEIFGSVAIFTDHLYPADGIAMVGSTEASWTRADWLGLIERYPRIALNLIAIVGRRQTGRAHVGTPVTTAHLVSGRLPEKKSSIQANNPTTQRWTS